MATSDSRPRINSKRAKAIFLVTLQALDAQAGCHTDMLNSFIYRNADAFLDAYGEAQHARDDVQRILDKLHQGNYADIEQEFGLVASTRKRKKGVSTP